MWFASAGLSLSERNVSGVQPYAVGRLLFGLLCRSVGLEKVFAN
jgi:hypothetical protein